VTDLDPTQDMEIVYTSLLLVARKSKKSFDDRMRTTVKELLAYRYTLKTKTVEATREMESLTQGIEAIDILTDRIFGVDSSRQRQFRRNNYEWNRKRPVRIYDYIQKLADIFPAEHLTRLLRDSQHLTEEELITLYEAKKGEAKQNDYSGYPTGVDLPKIYYGRPVRK
jgi:hypothetical protein